MCNFTPPETIVKIMDIVDQSVESSMELLAEMALFGVNAVTAKYIYTPTFDGVETSVVLSRLDQEGETHIGHSRCQPNDWYDRKIGLKVALVKAAKKFVVEQDWE